MRAGLALALTLILLLPVEALAREVRQEFTGRVDRVTDGDTIAMVTAQRSQIIRLVEIDAPEKGQPWGNRAKQALSSLVLGRDVRVVSSGQDRYGRTLGRLYVGGVDVNAELVKQGAAWAYRKYLTDQTFLTLEKRARDARRGLWSMPRDQTVAPWDWRAGKRTTGTQPFDPAHSDLRGLSASSAAQFQCGVKRYCSEMASCSEARLYLKQCGLSTIDGDGDGKPCEKLC